MDAATGRKVLKLGASDFELLLQKEKDLFYLREGWSCEQVSRVAREHRAKMEEARVRDKLAAEEKIAAAAKMLPAADQAALKKA